MNEPQPTIARDTVQLLKQLKECHARRQQSLAVRILEQACHTFAL